jgi:condensin complex subunit 3
LFLHCFTKGHDALQVTAIHILADILTTHPSLLSAQDTDTNLQKQILKIFSKGMKADYSPDVQSATTVALCKLMLTSVIQDVDLLKQVVICYFDPATKENAAVRQALTYFLPVYCHSRRENMQRMSYVAGGVMHALVDMGDELDEGEEMVGISTVGNILVDWTDARKLVVQDEALVSWDEAGRREVKAVKGDVHLDLAESLLEQAMNHGCSSKPFYGFETLTVLI